MRFRHRAPSTFSLWMVDVLCCSLGCVILLWLTKHREAQESEAWGSETQHRLDEASAKIGDLEKSLKRKQEEEILLNQLLAEARKKQKESSEKAEDLSKRLSTVAERRAVLEKLLEERVKELDTLNSLLTTLRKDNTKLADDLKTRTLTAEEKQKKIEELLKQVAALTEDKDALDKKLTNLAALKASLEKDLEAATGTGKTRQVKIDDLVAQLAKLNDSKEGVEKLLNKRLKEMEDLEKRLALLGAKNTRLEEELKTGQTQDRKRVLKIEDLSKLTDDLTKKLIDAEAAVRQLEKTAAMLPKVQEDLKGTEKKLTAEEAKAKLLSTDLSKALNDYQTLMLAKRELEKKLEGLSKETIEALAHKARLTEAEKKRDEFKEALNLKDKDFAAKLELLNKLQGDAARLQLAIDQRFAGIELTGKNVVFLVDTSGSMELIDENTPALHKWTGVCDTLVQLMKSMPKLEKYQVVTFAEDVFSPLGKEGEWIAYDAKTSPDRVFAAVKKIKPSGGTNLHKGFDTAFRLRKSGLDTIYLLSDGLPSDGDGLTAEQDRTIKDPNVRSVILSKHLRKKLKEDWNRPIDDQPRVRINSVGFFYESPDVGAFLWALSREHGGSFVGMSNP